MPNNIKIEIQSSIKPENHNLTTKIAMKIDFFQQRKKAFLFADT